MLLVSSCQQHLGGRVERRLRAYLEFERISEASDDVECKADVQGVFNLTSGHAKFQQPPHVVGRHRFVLTRDLAQECQGGAERLRDGGGIEIGQDRRDD